MSLGGSEEYVYVAWNDGFQGLDDDLRPFFSGHREDGQSVLEYSPEFEDASDAVEWWKQRGAEKILIRLDHRGYLWAGVGPPPIDTDTGQPMLVFSDEDPAGRPESSYIRAEAAQRAMRDQEAANEANKPVLMGERIRKRREDLGLSVTEVAQRISAEEAWITEVESGRTARAVTISQWVDLVWATHNPWPDPRRYRSTGGLGWVALDGLSAAEDIVQRHLDLAEADESSGSIQ
jgi:DNA-binding transcriptional regulator YiaG